MLLILQQMRALLDLVNSRRYIRLYLLLCRQRKDVAVNSKTEGFFDQKRRSQCRLEQVRLCFIYVCVFRFLVAAESEQSLTGHNGLSQNQKLDQQTFTDLGGRGQSVVTAVQKEGRGTTSQLKQCQKLTGFSKARIFLLIQILRYQLQLAVTQVAESFSTCCFDDL